MFICLRRLLIERSILIIEQNPLRRAVEIFILAAIQGPEEGEEAGQSQPQRDRHKIKEIVDHEERPVEADPVLSGEPRSRNALAMTTIEDDDIAIAASSGVR